MTETDFGKVAWDAYVKAVGGKSFEGKPLPNWDHLGEKQKYGWDEAVASVFEHIHHNIQHLNKKHKGTQNWQQLLAEILAFIVSHIPGAANTVPIPTPPTPNT